MDAEYIKKLISVLNFIPENGKNAIYVKYYPIHDNYATSSDTSIIVSVAKSG